MDNFNDIIRDVATWLVHDRTHTQIDHLLFDLINNDYDPDRVLALLDEFEEGNYNEDATAFIQLQDMRDAISLSEAGGMEFLEILQQQIDGGN